MIANEELKQNNALLSQKIGTMEKALEIQTKKVKYYEEQISGAALLSVKKEENKAAQKPKKEAVLHQALDLNTEETASKHVVKPAPNIKSKKETKKQAPTVQLNLMTKP